MYLQSLTCYKEQNKRKILKIKKEYKGGRVSTIYIYIYIWFLKQRWVYGAIFLQTLPTQA